MYTNKKNNKIDGKNIHLNQFFFSFFALQKFSNVIANSISELNTWSIPSFMRVNKSVRKSSPAKS